MKCLVIALLSLAHFALGAKEYWVSSTMVNWHEARTQCLNQGMQLAVVESFTDHQALFEGIRWSKDIIKDRQEEYSFLWLGGNDLKSMNNWTWESSGLAVAGEIFDPWIYNEENTCVAFTDSTELAYFDCSEEEYFVCERAASQCGIAQRRYDTIQTLFESLQKQYETAQSQNKTLQEQYETVHNQNESLQKKCETAESQYGTLQKKYENVQNMYEALQKQYETAQSQYKTKQNKYESIQSKNKTVQIQHEDV